MSIYLDLYRDNKDKIENSQINKDIITSRFCYKPIDYKTKAIMIEKFVTNQLSCERKKNVSRNLNKYNWTEG